MAIMRFKKRRRNKAKPITVNNINFPSINRACKFYGLYVNTAIKRLKVGWSPEETFEIIPRKYNSACEGKIYKIKNNINNKIYIGITINTLKQRFSTHKRDARRGKNTKLCKAIRKYGESKFTIKLLKEVENRKDLRNQEIKYILKYNSIENGYNGVSGGCGLGDRFGIAINYKGKTYNSITSLANYLKIDRYTLSARLERGMILDLPVKSKKKYNLKYKGKSYKSPASLARYLGINERTLHGRLSKGLPLDAPVQKRSKNQFTYEGVVYNSVRSLSIAMDIPAPTLYSRIRAGKSLKEILKTKKATNA
jgi:hypothetical protein